LGAVLPKAQFERMPLPFAAGFLAGRAFVEYRRKGGGRIGLLLASSSQNLLPVLPDRLVEKCI